jgi:hypothetical protein
MHCAPATTSMSLLALRRGGLNALMLGRLEFSIGEAIQAFSKFTETVFKESGGMKKALKEGHMFELARLQEAVDALLGDAANDRMFEPELALSCHVIASIKALRSLTPGQSFVTVVHRTRLVTPSIGLVRSYRKPPASVVLPIGHSWTIKQAACATAAASMYFEPLRISHADQDYHFEDAGLHGANNPTRVLLHEVKNAPLFADREIGCLVSIGTGKRAHFGEQAQSLLLKSGNWMHAMARKMESVERLDRLAASMVGQASDPEDVHHALSLEPDLCACPSASISFSLRARRSSYFRLTPDAGGDLSLTTYKERPAMDALVGHYLVDGVAQRAVVECCSKVSRALSFALY